MMADEPLPVYDRALALDVTGNRPEVADQLLNLLIHKDLPAQEQNLRAAYRDQRLDDLREVSHKLQGSARYCGTPALLAAAQHLEALLDTPDAPSVSAGVQRLLGEIHRLLETFGAPDV